MHEISTNEQLELQGILMRMITAICIHTALLLLLTGCGEAAGRADAPQDEAVGAGSEGAQVQTGAPAGLPENFPLPAGAEPTGEPMEGTFVYRVPGMTPAELESFFERELAARSFWMSEKSKLANQGNHASWAVRPSGADMSGMFNLQVNEDESGTTTFSVGTGWMG